MNPKISDFGTATMFHLNQSKENTGRLVGTYGYMPPEYVMCGYFSIKSDIFGVVVLEILSGQKINRFHKGSEGQSLLSFAWMNWGQGTALNLVDENLLSDDNTDLLRCINIALLCVQEDDALRPNMSTVIPMLSSRSITLPAPSRPGFLLGSDNDSGRWSAQHSANRSAALGNVYSNVVSDSAFHPR
ncbi:hypothetical protein Drorol1_Dr00010521 [Drosera rotundifolia]